MLKLDEIQKRLLKEVADLHKVPEGAYNIRSNGTSAGRVSTENIEITPREDGQGLTIRIKPGTKNESVHIPVVMTQTGLKEIVYNDFYIGEDADVTIVAGCGIDNCGSQDSQHDGIHRFYVGKNAHIRYVEKHYGSGTGSGKRILNPGTEVYQEEGSSVEMEMVQIKGVDDTNRTTTAELAAGAKLVVRERLMTHGGQKAISSYVVNLNGEGASADVVSRSVARDDSYQKFDAKLVGNAACSGHTECDSIIMDRGKILAVPALEANDLDAALVHEAAIGKIAGDQIIKLMTLGLTEAEAEEQIINGFLK
ncbi:MAG: SufD family Fe-S cluster assembly protein [Oribacterium sp.]|nr:SufD family Fe-S cluster assembly protein [Oribacterium sp.]MBO6308573.1 SufD family Fe-S cluster assembly protein [Oribacterium sp.]MBP3805838.1 SufD family Fe-S cluster assembly protein [Oribacterium sp.]